MLDFRALIQITKFKLRISFQKHKETLTLSSDFQGHFESYVCDHLQFSWSYGLTVLPLRLDHLQACLLLFTVESLHSYLPHLISFEDRRTLCLKPLHKRRLYFEPPPVCCSYSLATSKASFGLKGPDSETQGDFVRIANTDLRLLYLETSFALTSFRMHLRPLDDYCETQKFSLAKPAG